MEINGYVYLVGAGPGDQKLITVKGLEALQKADVILYDRLVNPLLLQNVRSDAELVYCGKLPNRHIIRQESINQLLVEKAKQGKIVVRLKGGDPAVFGRVGEEAMKLKENGIAYEIIPGITAGIAAASYAGIPVTHRDFGTSFTVVTGHDKSVTGRPKINWDALSKGIDTIAFYMGIKNLPHICENLILHGRASTTPVAVIQWGTTPSQKVVEGTLETIVSLVEEKKIENPAITLVGEIVALRKQLQWFEKKLLFGRKILVPNGDQKLQQQLFHYGAEVLNYPMDVASPCINNEAYRQSLTQLSNYEEMMFSSKLAAEIFFESLLANGIDIRSVKAKIYCQDRETLDFLSNKGLIVQITDEAFIKGSLLIGSQDELANAPLHVQLLITHTTCQHEPAAVAFNRAVAQERFCTILFTTKRSVQLFMEQLKSDGYDPAYLASKAKVICVGRAALLAAQDQNIEVQLYTHETDISSVVQFLTQRSLDTVIE